MRAQSKLAVKFIRANMMLSAFKTIIGYLITMLEKNTGIKLSRNSISGIYNYLKIDENLTTSGQPTKEQFFLIRDQGYKIIINLAPDNSENSLQDESLLLEKLGLTYIHIPVDFKKPSEKDFQKFVESLDDLNLNETWIHCAANMRVSAFIYRYRCEVLNEEREVARKDLRKIWEPVGVWKKFVSKT